MEAMTQTEIPVTPYPRIPELVPYQKLNPHRGGLVNEDVAFTMLVGKTYQRYPLRKYVKPGPRIIDLAGEPVNPISPAKFSAVCNSGAGYGKTKAARYGSIYGGARWVDELAGQKYPELWEGDFMAGQKWIDGIVGQIAPKCKLDRMPYYYDASGIEN